jgi:hypothetical protein
VRHYFEMIGVRVVCVKKPTSEIFIKEVLLWMCASRRCCGSWTTVWSFCFTSTTDPHTRGCVCQEEDRHLSTHDAAAAAPPRSLTLGVWCRCVSVSHRSDLSNTTAAADKSSVCWPANQWPCPSFRAYRHHQQQQQ